MPALSWSTSASIALRELRASRGKFTFVILSVAIGVAALTGVRGFSSSFRQTLMVRARSILAADLSARMFQQPSAAQVTQMEGLSASGIRMTPVTEMAGMATAAGSLDPLLVALKAIDPSLYPFYGSVELKPSMPLQNALAGDNVAVGEDLLVRLHLNVGDQIQLGDAKLRIAAVVVSEPDRLSGSFAAGPRILLSQQQLDATHLLAAGSRAGQRYLFQLPQRDDRAVAALKSQLEGTLPEAQITDYRETNPAISMALDRATGVLSLVSLVALVLGAVGVAMAMRTHLLERMDSIAIMKALGARSSHILRIYLLQTLALGVLGGMVGVALGIGVQLALPLLLAKLLGLVPEVHIAGSAIAAGLLTGLLTTVLFTIPPLLDIRKVRPILILRRAVEERSPGARGLLQRVRSSLAQGIAALVIAAGITLIATTLSDSAVVGRSFTLGLAGVLLVLIITAVVVLRALRFFLSKTRMSLPSTVRHGLANLYRPGNPSSTLLAAVGLGVMQIASIFLMSHALLNELKLETLPTLPNVFFIDIAPKEVEGVRALLKQQPGVRGEAEMLPVVASRILAINGVSAAQLKLENMPRRMLQSISLTWLEAVPPGTTVVRGQFWQAGEKSPQVAIGQRMSQRLRAPVGSVVRFATPGDPDHPIDATVAAILKSDGQHAFSRAEFVMNRAPLVDVPTVWYGGAHADPDTVGQMQRALFAKYPTVTVINVAQAMETLRNVLLQVALVVQFLAGFSIFAGLVILGSAIAGTRYRRLQEVVVLKTLGGTRGRIAAIFSIEFAMLGLVAGVIGLLFANITTRVVLRQLELEYHFLPGTNALALLCVAVLTVATGWLASYRVLGQKPLEVLREE